MNWFAKQRTKKELLDIIRENGGESRTLEGLHRSVVRRLKRRAMNRHRLLVWLTGDLDKEKTSLYELPSVDDVKQLMEELSRTHRIGRTPRERRRLDELDSTVPAQ